jgi:hypothetical protein
MDDASARWKLAADHLFHLVLSIGSVIDELNLLPDAESVETIEGMPYVLAEHARQLEESLRRAMRAVDALQWSELPFRAPDAEELYVPQLPEGITPFPVDNHPVDSFTDWLTTFSGRLVQFLCRTGLVYPGDTLQRDVLQELLDWLKPPGVLDFRTCDVRSRWHSMAPRIRNEINGNSHRLAELAGRSGPPKPGANGGGGQHSNRPASDAPDVAGTATAEEKPAGTDGDPGPSPILLSGKEHPVLIRGVKQPELTAAQYDVLAALVAAGSRGLTKVQLVKASGHTDAVKILGRIASASTELAGVILFPGKSGQGGYRIKPEVE